MSLLPPEIFSLVAPLRSPLWMVTQRPHLNEFVNYLSEAKDNILADPDRGFQFEFARSQIQKVQEDFTSMVKEGERKLHRLCEAFCVTLLPSFSLESVVIGEILSTRERFTITQNLTLSDLHSTLDIDLGTRQLARIKYFDGARWSRAALVSNVVQYSALEPNASAIHKIVSRVKAEEEIWNKVVDEIFNIDMLIKKDKQLVHLSRFVKDVLGIKIVTASEATAIALSATLKTKSFEPATLQAIGVEPTTLNKSIEWLETKDYLEGASKRSGWSAIKSVGIWDGTTFELQIQPLKNFLAERERLTRESHESFKLRRETIREQVSSQIPLFRFYRELLTWLFRDVLSDKSIKSPLFPGVSVKIRE
jgi:hypothetical protein